jgi:hypothetical protein
LAGIAGFLVPVLVESESNNAFIFIAYEFLFYTGLLLYPMKKKYIVLDFFIKQNDECLAQEHGFLRFFFLLIVGAVPSS